MNRRLSLLFATTSALLLFAQPASGQRESFDTTVLRRAEVIIPHILPQQGASGVSRRGLDAAGKQQRVYASAESVVFDNIYFKFDSAELRDRGSELQVDELAAALKSAQLKDEGVLIEGHTCDLGETEYNLQLSAQRAEVIRRMLIKRGIRPERILALGFGEGELVERVSTRDPASDAETKRMKSRRVVLRRLVPLTK